MSSGGYAVASTPKRNRAIPRMSSSSSVKRARQIQSTKVKKMKLTLKQRIRNWLMNDDDEAVEYVSSTCERDSLASEGMRFQLYKAAGGFVIETRKYDERKDEHHCKMYVITEEQDLGAELGKIITMESLR
jgi:hypothetical protein